MMLFKLSLKNIKKSFKDYAIYFFTLILGVAIFYIFNAMDSQTAMLKLSSSTAHIIESVVEMLSAVSVFVSFVLGFLVIYASRFLMKRRNKEFGVYLTLGMGKKKISLILFFETVLIGIISLILGLFLGTVLSQFMSIFVANIFEADMTEFVFTFSSSAMTKTTFYFGIIYMLVIIFNTQRVSRCKLIDLLHAEKKSEKVKIKNPILCILVFIFASVMLGYAYYQVTVNVNLMEDVNEILIPITMGIISTFLIFWSLSGLILRLIKNLKNVYYKGLNSFILKQISSKINTTVFSMTIICIMLFLTICILSSALSIKDSMNKNLKELVPADIQMELNVNGEVNPEGKIQEILESKGLDLEVKFKEMLSFCTYQYDDITIQTTLGSNKSLIKDYPFLNWNDKEELIKLSDYNKLAKLYGMKTYTLEEKEYIVVANFDNIDKVRSDALRDNGKISIEGLDYYPKYLDCKSGILSMSGNPSNFGYYILPDSVFADMEYKTNYLIANYNSNDDDENELFEEKFNLMIQEMYDENIIIICESYLNIQPSMVGLGGMVTFIGLYLGIIFLISSAAILALKELSDSTDNRERYNIIRKIGTDEKVINRALFKQIGIFFMFPLILAGIHSIFGMKFSKYILDVLGKGEMLKSVGVTLVFLFLIYGGYFLITYFCSREIIREKR